MAAQAAAILRSKRKRLESSEKEAGNDGDVYIQLANQNYQDALKNPVKYSLNTNNLRGTCAP